MNFIEIIWPYLYRVLLFKTISWLTGNLETILCNCTILSQIYLLNNKINSKIAKYLQVLCDFSKIFHWLNLSVITLSFTTPFQYSNYIFHDILSYVIYFRYYQINCTVFNSFRNVFWQLKNCSYILDLDKSVSFIMLIYIKLLNSIIILYPNKNM